MPLNPTEQGQLGALIAHNHKQAQVQGENACTQISAGAYKVAQQTLDKAIEHEQIATDFEFVLQHFSNAGQGEGG